MCGIVGVAGKIDVHHMSIFRDMLLMDVVRGQHSTSVLQIDGGTSTYDIARCVGHPGNLWKDSNNKTLLDSDGVCNYESKILLGHNRFATTGLLNIENPHPFDNETVVGVHNGTLYSTYGMDGDKEFEIDSEILYHHMDKNGIDDTWSEVYGAAALVYYDKVGDSLHLIRNKERSLFILHDEVRGVLYWASEAWMITAAIDRSKSVPYPTYTNSENKVVRKMPTLLTEDNLYSFKFGEKDSIERQETRKLKNWATGGYTTTVGYHNNSNNPNYIPKKSAKNPKEKINMGWSANTMKGDKSFRGRTFHLVMAYESYLGSSTLYRIVARFDDTKEKLYIYPQTYGEYTKYARLIEGMSASAVKGITKARPRLHLKETDQNINNKTGEVFGICTQHTDMNDIELKVDNKVVPITEQTTVRGAINDTRPTFTNVFLSNLGEPDVVSAFNKRLEACGQACCFCGDVLELEKVEDTLWSDEWTPMCNTCYTNGKDFQDDFNFYAGVV